jgi:hypothetical protein
LWDRLFEKTKPKPITQITFNEVTFYGDFDKLAFPVVIVALPGFIVAKNSAFRILIREIGQESSTLTSEIVTETSHHL